MNKNITMVATNVSVDLLKMQLSALVDMQVTQDREGNEILEGIINMLENMLDNYEHSSAKRNAPSGASGTLTGRVEKQLELDLGIPKETSDGSTASYYELPKVASELQHLIGYKNMNAQIGEIFRKCYRYGQVTHSEKLRDAKGMKYYIEAEITRLEKYDV